MPWARFDDDFPNHPKVLRAGPLALSLQVRSTCWSSHYLMDGFVPAEVVPALVQGFDSYDPKTPGQWADLMVACGLWDSADGGFRVHDFKVYNPTKKEVLRSRKTTMQQRIEAGRARALTGKRSGGRYISPAEVPAETPAETPPIHQPRTRTQAPTPEAEATPSAPAAASAGGLKVALVGKTGTAAPAGGGHPAVTAYCDAWRGRYGRNPDIAGKDAAALARLWKKQGAEEYACRLGRYMGDADPFLVKVAHSAGQFESRWNALGVAASAGPGTRANLNERWAGRAGGEVSL